MSIIQCQGSKAQELLKQDIMEAKLHEMLGKEELFDLRSVLFEFSTFSVPRQDIPRSTNCKVATHYQGER
jgi:hypothetical protein